MLVLNLGPVCVVRGIQNPFRFLVKSGITPHSASSLLDNTIKSVNLIHLEILCRILICEPNDLLVWVPEQSDSLPDTHPLHNLKATPSKGISEVISDIPYKELKSITKTIIDKTNTD